MERAITVADPGFPIGEALACSGGIGANLPCRHFWQEGFVKMKELDPVGEAATPGSANA